MAKPVRVRGLTEQEGQKLQRIVRRGSTSSVRFRRAMKLLASADGNTILFTARVVQADEDTVRDVIHKFNEMGLACLNPRWAGSRPRLPDRKDEDFVVQTATTRPTVLGKPSTRWSIRKLAEPSATQPCPPRPHWPGGPAVLTRPPRERLPAHQDREEVPRSGLRREARPD
jgi:transposase